MKMKPVFWMRLIPATALAVFLGVPVNAALAADAAPAAAPAMNMPVPGVAYGVSEVIKMFQGGISKDVILHYIENSSLPFHLTADDIIHLHTMGVPEEVTKALLQRDGQLQQQSMAYQQQMSLQQTQPPPQQPPPGYEPAAAVPPQVVVTPSTPAPVVAYPDYSVYPYYGYGYPYYWPSVVVGGFGWGWGGRYYHGGFYHGGGFHGAVGGFHGGGFHGGGFHGGHR
jgi:hypothetical protein